MQACMNAFCGSTSAFSRGVTFSKQLSSCLVDTNARILQRADAGNSLNLVPTAEMSC